MQNRYFGDVGDYGKYGLLRALTGQVAGTPDLSLGIVWFLFPDEDHNSDGKHISYLEKQEFRACDPKLFDGLRAFLADGRRTVLKIQNSNLLATETAHHNTLLSYGELQTKKRGAKLYRLDYRKRWIDRALDVTKNKQVVFLDPDNGIEVKSVAKHAPKGPKYIFWDEIKRFKERDQTLIIYHHLNRTSPSQDQIRRKIQEFHLHLSPSSGTIPVLFRRGSHRVFFVLPTKTHRKTIEERLRKMMRSPWKSHIDIFWNQKIVLP